MTKTVEINTVKSLTTEVTNCKYELKPVQSQSPALTALCVDVLKGYHADSEISNDGAQFICRRYLDDEHLKVAISTYQLINFCDLYVMLQNDCHALLGVTDYRKDIVSEIITHMEVVTAEPSAKTVSVSMSQPAEEKTEATPSCTIAPYVKFGATEAKSYLVTTEDSKFMQPMLEAINFITAKSGNKKVAPKHVRKRSYLPISRLEQWGGIEKFIKECQANGIEVAYTDEPIMGEERTTNE